MALLGDMITLVKKDGRSMNGIRASLAGEKIVFNVTDPPVEPGDKIVRELADGGQEEYVVLDAERKPGRVGRRAGRGDRYLARVERSVSSS